MPLISLQFDIFQFSNGLISFNDEQPLNIYEKSLQFDTFQFSNGLIFFKIHLYLPIFCMNQTYAVSLLFYF